MAFIDLFVFLQVEKLKQTATEALKSKEDTETKCQQKISDIVALMERHKVVIIVYRTLHILVPFRTFNV